MPHWGDASWVEDYNAAVQPDVHLEVDDVERGAFEYERYIFTTHNIPTRVHALHDVMNAAVWREFPLTKRALNARHIAEGIAPGSPNKRSPLRDGLTLFDESGVIIVGDAGDLPLAHGAHDWQTLFIAKRDHWHALKVIVFGHGLLESLATRAHKGLVGKTYWINQFIPAAQIDTFLALIVAQTDANFKAQLRPLPLCGVPGWDKGNSDADFYSDARVFRPLPTIRV
jgi:Protein of unknown function (DUF3025)